MTASALKTFRRNWIHRGGNDFRKIIALANMSFRTGTPYPSMPVLGNVVRCLIPRVLADASPWALLCRAVGTGFRFISAFTDRLVLCAPSDFFKSVFQFSSIFCSVLAQTVDEPFFYCFYCFF